MQYTFEQFEADFDTATNVTAKSEIITKALNELDLSDPETKEAFLQYRNELSDYRDQLSDEENELCKQLIESGEYEVYICTQDTLHFEKGSPYYIKVDDVAQVYEASITADNPLIKEYISKIEPMIWVIVDDGIGTKNRRLVYPKSVLNFDQTFQKL